MTTTGCVHCDELTTAVEPAHDQAMRALTDSDGPSLVAVAWLAAHLGASEAVIEPLARRHRAASGTELRDQQRRNRQLHRELRALEQALAGDQLAARINVAACRDRIVRLLAEHAAAEHPLLERLARNMGAEETAVAARRYRAALASAPTRPHPHLPHAMPVISSALRRAASVRDHALDVMDARHNPLPRPRRPHGQPGRWGQYLLGSPLPDPSDHESVPRRDAGGI